ncbi:MAG: hypothetical protein J6C89_01680 [Clostridia bacterium]|nr:hypothetical protein [Clostridia bacterium]
MEGALTGAAIGGVVGLAGGAVVAKIFAGSVLANTGAVVSGIKTAVGIKATQEVAKRTFSELIDDITKNPKRWKMVKEVVSESTKKGNKGGFSIKRVYRCIKTGEYIYEHILKDKFGRIIDQHFRPYGK